MGEEEEDRWPAAGGGPPITLNVGGKLYSTTLETLTRYPDSMLGAMFRGPRPARTDPRGCYFIDRDGKAFRHVLNFLRAGRLDLPEGYPELALLRAEADFYQIRPLLAELGERAGEQRRPGALLHADVDARERLLHFTLRRGPQDYALRTCPLRLFTANVFCTDGPFLAQLAARLGEAGGAPEEGEPRRRHHLRLEWAPRPPDLPPAEYAKQKVRPLRTAPPGGREVGTAAEFLEEVLKAALDHGFRLESVFPDPEDILNARSLRFVRH